jgi:hypothetical protein
MTASETLEFDQPLPEEPTRAERHPIHPGDYLVPVSVVAWAVGLSQTHVPSVQPYGLMTSLPVVYYAGILLLVVSAVLELRLREVSQWRMAVHAVVLVVMLFATAPIVYPAGRYAWLYKTIGVIQYMNVHGRTNDQIDIYQNWPGFFSLAAWFTKLAGVNSLLGIAKWAQPVLELAALPLLYLIYDSVGLPVRQRWVALLLYTSANWIGQDYLSPQGLGTVLSLGVMALAFRWMYTPRKPRDRLIRFLERRRLLPFPERWRSRDHPQDAGPAHEEPRSEDGLRWWSFPRAQDLRTSLAVCAAIIVVFFVLSVTHQLSPYMVAIQLAALSLAGLLRPRWLPIVLGAIAVGYLLPHFGFVNSHFGLLHSLGSFFSNAEPPSQSTTPPAAATARIALCCEVVSLGIWCLALAGAYLRRRAGEPVLALLLPAFSPFALLAILAYGNEGVLRVYLFSLPWCAALGASALTLPLSAARAKAGAHRAAPSAKGGQGTVRVLVVLVVVLALFFPAFFGDDSYNVMQPGEVAALTAFQANEPPGMIYGAIDNAAFHDTSNYNLLQIETIFGRDSLYGNRPINAQIANTILTLALHQTSRNHPVYIVISPSMINYDRAYGVVPVDAFAILEKSLADTPPWTLVVRSGGTVIYELPPDTLPVYKSSNPALQPRTQKSKTKPRG